MPLFGQLAAADVVVVGGGVTPGTLFGQGGIAFDFDAPPLVVGQVPVELVELVLCHAVEQRHDLLPGEEVARHVEHEAPPCEARRILDFDRRDGAVAARELAQRGDDGDDAAVAPRLEADAAPRHAEAVASDGVEPLRAYHREGRLFTAHALDGHAVGQRALQELRRREPGAVGTREAERGGQAEASRAWAQRGRSGDEVGHGRRRGVATARQAAESGKKQQQSFHIGWVKGVCPCKKRRPVRRDALFYRAGNLPTLAAIKFSLTTGCDIVSCGGSHGRPPLARGHRSLFLTVLIIYWSFGFSVFGYTGHRVRPVPSAKASPVSAPRPRF